MLLSMVWKDLSVIFRIPLKFFGQEKETILHLVFRCIYSRLFWKYLEFYINRKFKCMIEICIFDVFLFIFYTENKFEL